MSDWSLPDRPDLDQLKRQAKELLKSAGLPRLRDAQRAIAERYGFASWDALREHVERLSGHVAAAATPCRSLQYDDHLPDVVLIEGPLTGEAAGELAAQQVSGVKVDVSVPRDYLLHLAEIPSLRRLDLSNRPDVIDDDLAFLDRMPWLTAISMARCPRIGNRAVSYLRGHHQLEEVNLHWTATGDDAIASLSGKSALSRVAVGNQVTDEGLARLKDCPALAAPGTVDSFLSISGARTLTDAALAHVGELKGLGALDVHMWAFGSPHYTARGVAHLNGLPSLEALNFHGALTSDAVLGEIARIPRLLVLHCQDIVSSDEGFLALAKRETLEELSSRVCARLTDRGFMAIAQLPRLKRLNLGGPRVTDAAATPLADAAQLEDLVPILFGDEAFVHIGRIRRLRKLTNMYNRATTDAATRYLRGHSRLAEYGAYGTQISDESLLVLAGLPKLETVVFENCAGITDEGLGALARGRRVHRISVWSCARVDGSWRADVPHGVEASSQSAPPEQSLGYRAETLIDYPDLRWPEDAVAPDGTPPVSAVLPPLGAFGVKAAFLDEGVQLSVESGVDPRWVGVVTRDVYAVPVRIDIVVRPLTELRLVFAGHNRFLVFDERGYLRDPTPWFLKLDAEKGEAHDEEETRLGADDWARVTLDIGERRRHLFVNGRLRHSWAGDFAGIRSRIGIGLQRSALSVREFKVEPLA